MTTTSADTSTTPTPGPRLQPGDTAPTFSLTAADGTTVSSESLRGHRYVLYFYPAAMTPGCTTQACDFRDALPDFSEAGLEVYGVSPDSPAKLQKFIDRDDLTFTLLSDPTKETLAAYGAFGEKTMYGKTTVGVIRSTVVIAADGTVELAQYNVRAKGHVERLRSALALD